MIDTDWMKQVERRLNALETRTAVDEVHRVMVEKRLHAIEDTLKWLVRIVIGALILGMIGFAVRGGFAVV
ncbi:MAG: hemolysin XhlA family protein [Pseudomonadota bacterium]